jgi:hypothetical protein
MKKTNLMKKKMKCWNIKERGQNQNHKKKSLIKPLMLMYFKGNPEKMTSTLQ